MTLFDEGCFRKTKKSALYDDFPLCSDSVDIKTCYTVVNGGFLLHRVKWNGGAPFSSIYVTSQLPDVTHHLPGSKSSILCAGFTTVMALKPEIVQTQQHVNSKMSRKTGNPPQRISGS
ncbi:hypothetical protein WDU94_012210 [Cyamophila willieti]